MFGEEEARKLIDKVFKRGGCQSVEILLLSNDQSLTRFANNTIHQNVAERDADLIVRCFIGKRMGIASTNRFDETALDEVIARARENAAASPEDPYYPGLPEPADYQTVRPYDQATASYPPKSRAEAIGIVCRLAAEKGLNASGAFSTGRSEVVIANSLGVFAYHAATSADFQTVVMSADSSGRAHASAWKAADIDAEALGSEAVQKAELSRNPRAVPPGEYTVVLDPYVTEDLLHMLNFHGMGAQAVFEGRSWMNDRLGQKAMSAEVSIWDDGLDLTGLPMPFDYEGVPRQRVEIVSQGVVQGPVYDRYTAARMGKVSTGHALPPTARGFGPIAANLFMAPGIATLEEMIRSTRKGLHITRFWYTRLVHPRDCVITGMTRDGVFLIENGELAYPVKNLRFTQSYVEALNHVEMVGKETRLLASEFGGMAVRVPALKLSAFNFTGATV